MWHIFYYFDIFHLNKWVYSHWLVSRHDTGTLCKYLTLVFLSWESSARQELRLDLQILSSDLRHVIHYLSYNISQAYSVHMDIQFICFYSPLLWDRILLYDRNSTSSWLIHFNTENTGRCHKVYILLWLFKPLFHSSIPFP